MKRANKKPSPFSKKQYMAAALFCLACGFTACHEPKLVLPNGEGAAHAEHYAFDIVTISEWAGHILPTETSFNLLISHDNYYLTQYFTIHNAQDCKTNEYLENPLEIMPEDIPNIKHELPTDLKGMAGEPEIAFRVVQYGGEDNLVHCTLLHTYALQDKS